MPLYITIGKEKGKDCKDGSSSLYRPGEVLREIIASGNGDGAGPIIVDAQGPERGKQWTLSYAHAIGYDPAGAGIDFFLSGFYVAQNNRPAVRDPADSSLQVADLDNRGLKIDDADTQFLQQTPGGISYIGFSSKEKGLIVPYGYTLRAIWSCSYGGTTQPGPLALLNFFAIVREFLC